MKLYVYGCYIVLSHYTAYYGTPVTKLNHVTCPDDTHYSDSSPSGWSVPSPYHTYHVHLIHNILFPHHYMLPCHPKPMSPKSEQLGEMSSVA